MQLALLSRSGHVQQAYCSFLGANDVHPVHVTSITELYQRLPDVDISGMVIDIPTMIKATEKERKLLQALENIFPHIRANWNPQAGFRALFCDSSKSGEENLYGFLQLCLTFNPRPLRREERVVKNYNILIWPEGESEHTARRAFTTDISRGGLFICTCDPLPEGSNLWVYIKELGAPPFKISLRWGAAWGSGMHVPGCGSKFVELNEELLSKLEAALRT